MARLWLCLHGQTHSDYAQLVRGKILEWAVSVNAAYLPDSPHRTAKWGSIPPQNTVAMMQTGLQCTLWVALI